MCQTHMKRNILYVFNSEENTYQNILHNPFQCTCCEIFVIKCNNHYAPIRFKSYSAARRHFFTISFYYLRFVGPFLYIGLNQAFVIVPHQNQTLLQKRIGQLLPSISPANSAFMGHQSHVLVSLKKLDVKKLLVMLIWIMP